jgi:hypothetical protein
MRILIASACKMSTLKWIVPTDGTTAATAENGDFGRSPFFGQLSDKALLVYQQYGALRHQAQ